jgi:hypothetical protein
MHHIQFKDVNEVTNFDAKQCHKWAQLLLARQQNLNQALTSIKAEDFDLAKRLFSKIFAGVNGGKQADPGMAGSLLYHMAMITKMESETRMLIDELHVDLPETASKLSRIYSDFETDAKELTKEITPFTLKYEEIASAKYLGTNEKVNYSPLTGRASSITTC